MKRLIPVVAAAALLLTGCVSVRLDYGVDTSGALASQWQVDVRRPKDGGNAVLDEGMNFAHDQMSLLASQWESRGIATETSDGEGEESVTGRRTFSGTREKAFEELTRWMKEDGETPFSAVTANHTAGTGAEEYYIDATLDWKDLINPSSLASTSAELRAGAGDVQKNCEITVTIRLPGTAVEHDGEVTEADGVSACTVKATCDKPARIMLHTRVEKAFTATAAITEKPEMLMKWGLVGICGLAGLLMLIIAIRCIIKMARYRGYEWN